MPELPDVEAYIEALRNRILGRTVERIEVIAPFLLRTAMPPLSTAEGQEVTEIRRLGKRICIGLETDLWLVLHLMIAGRLHWHEGKPKASKSPRLATFRFENGSLVLTEAGSRKRASLHLISGKNNLRAMDPGGSEIFEINLKRFAEILQSSNHTLKRALTDPRLFSGIGNAYSDEILFSAQLSPIALTQKLNRDEIERLFEATRNTLSEWRDRLVDEASEQFPEKVTAFRNGMAVHGRYNEPCLRCGGRIRRIRYASNETNYCPNCQTGGKLLADRALSRLLGKDWPKTVEELENLTATSKGALESKANAFTNDNH
jgi:formamidopyrimidine-DNA glycosylase